MNQRPFGFGLLVMLLAVLAAPLAAHAQNARTVTLPVTGLTVELPGNWTARQTPYVTSDGNSHDMITRTSPATPMLFMTLIPVGGKTCAEWDTLQRGGKSPRVASPKYLPPGWYPAAFEGKSTGDSFHIVSFCGDMRRGVLLGAFSYRGSLSDPDVQFVAPILAVVAKAGNLSSAAVASGTHSTKLPVTGLSVELPDGWGAEASRDGQVDLLRRSNPPTPLFGLALKPFPAGAGSCSDWSAGIKPSRPGERMVERPPYHPAGWHAKVHEQGTRNDGAAQGVGMCLDRPGGSLIAIVNYGGKLGDADFATVKPLLERVARAANGTSAPAAVAAPVAPPVASPAPATAVPPPSSSAAAAPPPPPPVPEVAVDEPSSSRRYDTASRYDSRPDPLEEERYRPRDDDEPDESEPSQRVGHLPTLEFGVAILDPDDDRFENGGGGTFGIDGILDAEPESTLSFAMTYGVVFGYVHPAGVPLDGQLSLGAAVHVGPVTLFPLAGVGLDTMGGDADAAEFSVGSAFYWDVQGRLRIAVSSYGVEGGIARLFRGSIGADAADIPNETRILGRLYKVLSSGKELSLGLRMTDYSVARTYTGVFGLGL